MNRLLILLFIFIFLIDPLYSDIIVDITDRGDDGILATLSGDATLQIAMNSDSFILTSDTAFIPAGRSLGLDPIAANITNETQVQTEQVTHLSLEDGRPSGLVEDSIILVLGEALIGNPGDLISISGTFQKSPGSGINFSDLTKGSFSLQNETLFSGSADFFEAFGPGNVTINVTETVPEPSSYVLLVFIFLGFNYLRKKQLKSPT